MSNTKGSQRRSESRKKQRSDAPVGASPVGALKIKQAAKYLGGVSQITVRRLIERGLIKPNRALRHLLIPIIELDRFLAEGQQ